MPFEDFTKPVVGFNFISNFFHPSLAKLFDYSVINGHRNKSLSKLDTEINYVKNFLGHENHLDLKDLANVAQKRLEARTKEEEFVQNLFHDLFDNS